MSFYTERAQQEIALYDILERLALELRPSSYLEIGCREGGSLLHVLHSSPSLSLIVIADIWDGNYGGSGRGSHHHISALLDTEGYSGHRLFLSGRSQDTLFPLSATFDLILVDGDHSTSGAATDLALTWPMLRPGGILVFDDTSNAEHLELGYLFHKFADRMGAEIIEESTVGVGAGALRKAR